MTRYVNVYRRENGSGHRHGASWVSREVADRMLHVHRRRHGVNSRAAYRLVVRLKEPKP